MKYKIGQVVFAKDEFMVQNKVIAEGTEGVVVGPSDDGPFTGPAVKVRMDDLVFDAIERLLTGRPPIDPILSADELAKVNALPKELRRKLGLEQLVAQGGPCTLTPPELDF